MAVVRKFLFSFQFDRDY